MNQIHTPLPHVGTYLISFLVAIVLRRSWFKLCLRNLDCFTWYPKGRQKKKEIRINCTNCRINLKNYNFLACDWFKKVLFSTNSLAKLLSDSLLLDSSISQIQRFAYKNERYDTTFRSHHHDFIFK